MTIPNTPHPAVISPDDHLRERIEKQVRTRILKVRAKTMQMPIDRHASYAEALEWVLTDVLGVSVI